MTRPIVGAGASAPATTPDARLRKVAKQLEGVFTEQLYKAMRATVPQDEGIVSGGSGEEMFTGLMDQKLAADTPMRWEHGLGEAIYHQLRRALPTSGADAATDGTAPAASAAQAAQAAAHAATTPLPDARAHTTPLPDAGR